MRGSETTLLRHPQQAVQDLNRCQPTIEPVDAAGQPPPPSSSQKRARERERGSRSGRLRKNNQPTKHLLSFLTTSLLLPCFWSSHTHMPMPHVFQFQTSKNHWCADFTRETKKQETRNTSIPLMDGNKCVYPIEKNNLDQRTKDKREQKQNLREGGQARNTTARPTTFKTGRTPPPPTHGSPPRGRTVEQTNIKNPAHLAASPPSPTLPYRNGVGRGRGRGEGGA